MQGNVFQVTDVLMDLWLPAMIQLCFSRLHIKRLLLSFLLLRACTLAALSPGMNQPQPFWMHIAVFLLAGAIAAGANRPSKAMQAALCMFMISAAAAGCGLLAANHFPAVCTGSLAAMLLMRRRFHPCHRWDVEICVEFQGTSCTFPALIDTGNRLKEHKSGLGVLIVEQAAVPELAKAAEQMSPEDMRTLPFGVLGSSGELACFRPDHVSLQIPGRGNVQAPPCCMAIYPGRIPGPTCALAPPEFADILQYKNPFFTKIKEGIRRFGHYVVFKCEAIHLWFGGSNSKGFGLLHRRQRPASPSHEP